MSRQNARARTSRPPKSSTRSAPTPTSDADCSTGGARLRELLSWGLYTDDDPDSGCGYDVVLRKAAVVQLKAIAIALVNGGEDKRDSDPDHHMLGISFSPIDAAEAVAGVAAMLEHGGEMIADVREADHADAESESVVAS